MGNRQVDAAVKEAGRAVGVGVDIELEDLGGQPQGDKLGVETQMAATSVAMAAMAEVGGIAVRPFPSDS
ncbi:MULTISPECIES: hypothetical protein [unclassified Pseudomonas]|uniref:hypothetical protein n=1 Tax=unclassified Pseudomonas TaxID=196821 RepID=UPI002AC94727|nr:MULTISPECIES: hypothetical protein [unclassified Pseudomonas]MEB0040045.1 hypothetical protein [Pseudomonas sp. MH10]MEB0076444.1 hypothetical protein [Pseudomonas sp. MH10out]MEB0091207.1 hypothetical protein [Pseudomonas sp. CCI4.2]MEB0100839.1 hypothetical protein [Pseudomonas sp. CCI3.2]MEB0128776.1 hypothetical protein [Pseudomonas sp. CCI2.4]